MPHLPDPRNEAMAIGLADGLTNIEAYLRSGYKGSEKWASKMSDQTLRRYPEIRTRAQEILAERDQVRRQSYSTVETDLLHRLGTVIDRCMQRIPVLGERGRPINTICKHCKTVVEKCPSCDELLPPAQWTFQAREATNAIVSFGHHHGMFIKRTEVRHGPLDPLQGSPSELKARIFDLIEKLGWQRDVLERFTRSVRAAPSSGQAKTSDLRALPEASPVPPNGSDT